MSSIIIDRESCKSDGVCVAVCPARTLALDAEGYPAEVPGAHCILCGHCAAVCPTGALTHTGLPEGPMLPMPKERPSAAVVDGLLMSRRSIRVYRDRPVSREMLAELLDVARHAPTATNAQNLHWIAVEGKEKVRAVAQGIVNGLGLENLAPATQQRWAAGYDFVLRGAPAVVVACAPRASSWGAADCNIALTHLELAAMARGLGACWAGYLTRIASIHEPLRQMLGVPEDYAVCAALMLGWSKFSYQRIPPRKPLSVHWV